jgi:hypothetical protein
VASLEKSKAKQTEDAALKRGATFKPSAQEVDDVCEDAVGVAELVAAGAIRERA